MVITSKRTVSYKHRSRDATWARRAHGSVSLAKITKHDETRSQVENHATQCSPQCDFRFVSD